MRLGGIEQPQRLRADLLDQLVDHRQHRWRRAERAIQRQPRQIAPARLGIGGEGAERRLEIERAGALEAEDRLLEVADGEDRPRRAPRLPPLLLDEELARQRAHDAPLRGIGVLRLVHQDVIDAPIELEAHPIARSRLLQQRHRRSDQIVEIDHAAQPLRLRISERIGLARAQACRDQRRERRTRAHREQGRSRLSEARTIGAVIGIAPGQLGRDGARLALPRQRDRHQILEQLRPLRRRRGEEARDPIGVGQPGLGAPGGAGGGDAAQAAQIEAIVGERRDDRLLDIAQRQIERGAHLGLDREARAQRRHRLGQLGRADQIAFRGAFTEAAAERLHVADQPQVALPLGRLQQLGKCPPLQRRLGAALERAEAGRQPRLDREPRQQRLAEGVNRLDRQPARRIQHPREQRARLRHCRLVVRLAQREQLFAQRRIGHPHPGGEARLHPLRHLGRARLGEGEAEDRVRRRAVQQQPQHARAQHMRLARAGGGGEPHLRVGLGRGALRPRQRHEGLDALAHGLALIARSAHTIRPAASAGHIHRRAHARGGAWRRTASPPADRPQPLRPAGARRAW